MIDVSRETSSWTAKQIVPRETFRKERLWERL
jgi:hypothetical protein